MSELGITNRHSLKFIRDHNTRRAAKQIRPQEAQPIEEPGRVPRVSYPNPNPHGVPLRVVRHRDGAVVAVCTEEAGTRIRLAETDLALFALDMKLLRRTICNALGLDVARGAAADDGPLVRLGSWAPKPAASFPVVMVRCDGRRLRACMQTLALPHIAPALAGVSACIPRWNPG